MSSMWQATGEGTATGPSIIVGSIEVVAYWSDDDGVRLDIGGPVEDMTPGTARALADALRQLADLPGPQ